MDHIERRRHRSEGIRYSPKNRLVFKANDRPEIKGIAVLRNRQAYTYIHVRHVASRSDIIVVFSSSPSAY